MYKISKNNHSTFNGVWHLFYKFYKFDSNSKLWNLFKDKKIVYPKIISSKNRLLNGYVLLKLTNKRMVKNGDIVEKADVFSVSLKSIGLYKLTNSSLSDEEAYKFYTGKLPIDKVNKKKLKKVFNYKEKEREEFELNYIQLTRMNRSGILLLMNLSNIPKPDFLCFKNSVPYKISYKKVKTFVLRNYVARYLKLINENEITNVFKENKKNDGLWQNIKTI